MQYNDVDIPTSSKKKSYKKSPVRKMSSFSSMEYNDDLSNNAKVQESDEKEPTIKVYDLVFTSNNNDISNDNNNTENNTMELESNDIKINDNTSSVNILYFKERTNEKLPSIIETIILDNSNTENENMNENMNDNMNENDQTLYNVVLSPSPAGDKSSESNYNYDYNKGKVNIPNNANLNIPTEVVLKSSISDKSYTQNNTQNTNIEA